MSRLLRRVLEPQSSESGMTLVEIVVALAIMFFILTGVLGLVLQSTRMSAQAKQQNVLTNAVSAYTEWLHTLPFENVALVDDGGDLNPVHEVDTGAYTVTIRPTVTPGENSALKVVLIECEIERPDGWSQSIVTQVTVRDRSLFMMQGTVDQAARPKVAFLPGTPPDGSVVWSDDWVGGKLTILVEAEAAEGRQIASVSYRLEYGNTPLTDKSGNIAQWLGDGSTFNSNTSSQPAPFMWDTQQSQTDAEGNVIQVASDGPHTIIVEVVDDAGARETIHRSFIVDNTVPPTPGPLTLTQSSVSQTRIKWDTVQDGAALAKGYETELLRHDLTTGAWVEAVQPNPTGPDPEYDLSHSAFERFMVRVRAYSPRPLYSDWQDWTTFETRPEITGTYTVEAVPDVHGGYRVVSQLSVSEPAFPTTGQTTYRFWIVDSAGDLQGVPLYDGPLNTLTHQVSFSAQNKNQWDDRFPTTRYLCEVLYTPEGGSEQSIRTNTVTTAFVAYDATGVYAFTGGSW